jgi:hypothetical protein
MRMGADARDDGRIEGEAETRGERDGAEHAHRIFAEALPGVADRSNDPVAKVLQPADIVDDREGRDVVEERVDGEVAAKRVFLRRPEGVVVADLQLAPSLDRRLGRRRLVFGSWQDVAAERRDLDRLGTEAHVGKTKPASDNPAVAEEFFDLIGMRVGPDVEILRPSLQQ